MPYWLVAVAVITAGLVSGGLAVWIWSSTVKNQVENRKAKEAKQDENAKDTGASPSQEDERLGTQKAYARDRVNYHNGAIYKDIALFVKLSLAVIGGALYLVCQQCPGGEGLGDFCRALLLVAGTLEGLLAVVSSMFIYSHQKSKIKHWPDCPDKEDWPGWLESWAVFGISFVGGAVLVALAVLFPLVG